MSSYEKNGFLGELIENSAGEEGLALVDYRGDSTKVNVPSRIAGVPVMELRDTFMWNDRVEEVTVPKGVTLIGGDTFRGCISLGKVKLPGTLQTIQDYAFCGCRKLEEVVIPQADQVNIGAEAFEREQYPWNEQGFLILGGVLVQYLGEETVVRVPEGVKQIRPRTFIAENMETLILPSTLKQVDSDAFMKCNDLREILFTEPSALEIIKPLAFDCVSLESIALPSSLKRIEQGGFVRCPKLTHVTLSPHTKVEKGGFSFPVGEEKFYFPENVVASFGDLQQSRYYLYHFEHMEERTAEERAELPQGMARFLREVNLCIPCDIGDMKKSVPFLNTIFTERTEKEVAQFFDWGLTLSLLQFEMYLDHTIQEGKTLITAYLLEKKKRLYSEKEIEDYETRKAQVEQAMVLPTLEELSRKWNVQRVEDGFMVMGYRGGSGREVLTSSTADGVKIGRVTGSIYPTTGTKDWFADLHFVEIGEGVVLGERAFRGSGLEEIRLPTDLKEIPFHCFFKSPLREVELPEGLTEIGERGFSETELEVIVLPKSLKTLYQTAFNECKLLRRVVFRGSLEILSQKTLDLFGGEGHFTHCPSLVFVGTQGGENQLERLREEGIISEN